MKTRKLTKLAVCLLAIGFLLLVPRIGKCQSCVEIDDQGCPGATTGSCGQSSNCGGPVLVTTGPDDMQCAYTDSSPYSTCVPGTGDGVLTTTTMNCIPSVAYTVYNEELEVYQDEFSDPLSTAQQKVAAAAGIAIAQTQLAGVATQPCQQVSSGIPPTTEPYQYENNTATGVCCPGAQGDN